MRWGTLLVPFFASVRGLAIEAKNGIVVERVRTVNSRMSGAHICKHGDDLPSSVVSMLEIPFVPICDRQAVEQNFDYTNP